MSPEERELRPARMVVVRLGGVESVEEGAFEALEEAARILRESPDVLSATVEEIEP